MRIFVVHRSKDGAVIGIGQGAQGVGMVPPDGCTVDALEVEEVSADHRSQRFMELMKQYRVDVWEKEMSGKRRFRK